MAEAQALQEIINEDEGTDLEDAVRDAVRASMAGDAETDPAPEATPESDAEADAKDAEAKAAADDPGDDDPAKDTDDETDTAGAGEEPGDADTESAKAEETAASDDGTSGENTDQTKTDETPEALPPIEPPARFSETHKETFRSLPREAQVFVHDRNQEMEADYTRKTQDLAQARKAADAMNSAIQPWNTYIASLGTTPEVAFDTLMRHDRGLRTGTDQEKTQRFAQLAQHYGIDLEALSDEDVAPPDPAMVSLQQRQARLEGHLTAQAQQADTEAEQQLQTDIQTFAMETDAQGALTHPHFEDVRGQMSALISANQNLDMEQAYHTAVCSDPKLREANLAEDRRKAEAEAAKTAAETKAKAKTERAEKVKTARKAAAAVDGGNELDGPAAERPETSLQDEVARNYRLAASSA